MKWLWFALVLALTAYQGSWLYRSLSREGQRAVARKDLHRLARATFQLAPGGNPPLGEAFWRASGREGPLLDPWGEAYLLEQVGAAFFWRSAAVDRLYHTADDLLAPVIYQEVPTEGREVPLSLDGR